MSYHGQTLRLTLLLYNYSVHCSVTSVQYHCHALPIYCCVYFHKTVESLTQTCSVCQSACYSSDGDSGDSSDGDCGDGDCGDGDCGDGDGGVIVVTVVIVVMVMV